MDQTAPVRQLAATTALGRPMQRRPRPAQRSAARDVAPLAQPGAPPGARPPRPPTTNVVGPDRDDQTTEGPTDSSASLTSSRLEAISSAFVERVMAAERGSIAHGRLLAEVGEIGEREIIATAELSRRLVDRPVRAIVGTLDGASPIARGLAELREAVEELDPSRLGTLSDARPRKLLGLIPIGDPVPDALERYGRARARIQAVLGDLSVARSRLQAEIAAIGQDQQALTTEIETLHQYAELARRLDEGVEAGLRELAASEPARAEELRTDLLFAIRQRRQDLLIQLAVATQGDAALRIVQDNNQQVVRTIRMAMTTTAAAMRTSIAVAQALVDQRRILAQLRTVLTGRQVATGGPVAAQRASSAPSAAPPAIDGRAAVGADLAGLKQAGAA